MVKETHFLHIILFLFYMKYLSPLCMSVRINVQFSRFDKKCSVCVYIIIYIYMSHKFTYIYILYLYILFNQPGLIMISIVMNLVFHGFMGLYPSLDGRIVGSTFTTCHFGWSPSHQDSDNSNIFQHLSWIRIQKHHETQKHMIGIMRVGRYINHHIPFDNVT